MDITGQFDGTLNIKVTISDGTKYNADIIQHRVEALVEAVKVGIYDALTDKKHYRTGYCSELPVNLDLTINL